MKLTKKEKAREITVKIFAIILEEQNGYTKEEIKSGKLDEECIGCDFSNRIEKLIYNAL